MWSNQNSHILLAGMEMNSHFGNGHFLKKMDTQPSILEILSKKKSKKNENVSINNS